MGDIWPSNSRTFSKISGEKKGEMEMTNEDLKLTTFESYLLRDYSPEQIEQMRAEAREWVAEQDKNPGRGCLTCVYLCKGDTVDPCLSCIETDLTEGGEFEHPAYEFNPNWFEDSRG